MTANTETAHEIVTTGTAHHYRAHCLPHNCLTLDTYATADRAYRAFQCDEGSNARFIVQFDDEPPMLADLSGVGERLRTFVEDRAYGYGIVVDMRVWRWLGDGQLETLTIACKTPGEYNDEDYAYPVWAAEGVDGTGYARVSVRIDGRA